MPPEPFQVIVESRMAFAYQFATDFVLIPTDSLCPKSQTCKV